MGHHKNMEKLTAEWLNALPIERPTWLQAWKAYGDEFVARSVTFEEDRYAIRIFENPHSDGGWELRVDLPNSCAVDVKNLGQYAVTVETAIYKETGR